MAKTNFTKVEEALSEGLLRMNIAGLHNMATVASQLGVGYPPTGEQAHSRTQLLAALNFEAKHCKDDGLFAAGGLSRRELKKLLERPGDLAPEGWQALEQFREKADAYKKSLQAKKPEDADEKLVEAQRKRHINKRYNTKEQWLPLH